MKSIDSSITIKICWDKWEVKWQTQGWPSLTSDDLKTKQFRAWCLSRKSKAYQDIILTKCLLFGIICPPMNLKWSLMTFIELQTSMIVGITIAKKIGMLHIKWNLETAVLLRKYALACLRSTFIDLCWPIFLAIINANTFQGLEVT